MEIYMGYYTVPSWDSRQPIVFPGLKTVKQMEEMKQVAVGLNNLKKSGFFFKWFQFPL